MTEQQRHELVQDWIKQEIGDKHPYSYAIHNPLAMDGKEQPHCHLMICERTLDGIDRGADQFFKRYNSKDPTKGGAKKANTGLDHATRKEQIKQQRSRWEQLCNKHLERMGSHERVDLRNYKERGANKPQNISMTDMLKPDVRKAYKDTLTARQELKTATFETYQAIGDFTLELHKLEQRTHDTAKTTQNHDSEQRPLYSTSRPYEATAGRADSLQQERGGVLQASSQYSRRSENHNTEQQSLRSPSYADPRTAERIDSLQQSRRGISESSIQGTSQSEGRSGETKPREPKLTANEQQARKYHDELWEQQRAEHELFKANLDNDRKRTENAIKARQDNSARVTPTTHIKSLKTPNRPNNERIKLDIADKQKIIQEYGEKVQTTAKAILDNQLKALRDKSKPMLAKVNHLLDNKPLFLGKDKWEKDKDEALNAYNAIKTTHDSMKAKGVTDEHYQQAREHIAKNEPSYHAQVQQAIKDVKAFEQAKLDKLAREHGADFHAQLSERYSGKILRADDRGVLQQTKDGIVYHPPLSRLEQGKSYNLTSKGEHYEVQQSYDYQVPIKSQERQKGR